MRKGDLIIGLIAILLMAILGVGYKIYMNSLGTERYVNIYVDNKLVKSYNLTPNLEVEYLVDNEYGYNLIYIHDGGVEVIEADCEGQDDVRKGFVKMPGIPIICVPHHLKVIIEGGEPENDAVAQ